MSQLEIFHSTPVIRPTGEGRGSEGERGNKGEKEREREGEDERESEVRLG